MKTPLLAEVNTEVLYYDNNSSLEHAYNGSQGAVRESLAKLRQPTGVWILNDTSWLGDLVRQAGNEKLVLVAYNINDRDCSGAHSAGGAANADAYRQWARSFADQIGDHSPIVILEPDALPDAGICANTDERLDTLRYFVNELKTRTKSTVYLDAGNSTWRSAEEMAAFLMRAGIDQADGIALNTSNYKRTEDEIRFGNDILSRIGMNKGMVIDTSRNGNGPPPGDQWCNPAGRLIGEAPTLNTGIENVDAFLWAKKPGESDGTKGYGNCGDDWIPSHFATGQFNMDIALSLAGAWGNGGGFNEKTPDAGSCQQHKDWGNCYADWMLQYDLCKVNCGRWRL